MLVFSLKKMCEIIYLKENKRNVENILDVGCWMLDVVLRNY